MDLKLPKFTLEEGLDLRELQTTGSFLHINEVYDESDYNTEPSKADPKAVDFIGEPIENFEALIKKMDCIDSNGCVKKKILEEGGGLPLHEGCTVFIAFSGYWENEKEPFDVMSLRKPLEVDLKDHGLLPGLDIAIKSMLVGELSVFLFSHEVMYGEFGIPPRIKPKAQCAFFIKLVKSILTPKQGKINFSEPNMFGRVYNEAKLLLQSGLILFKSSNFTQSIQVFKKAVAMLHKCRFADEKEEKLQEKMLNKLYFNLAVCYNKTKQPLKACTACNELNRLRGLWNNGKVLFQNAKSLRMIGQFAEAERRLKRAMHLSPNSEEIKAEMELLQRTKDLCNQTKLVGEKIAATGRDVVSDNFKMEVDNLIKNFKENANLCKLTLPTSLSSAEMGYVKEACIRENLFFNKVPKHSAELENTSSKREINEVMEHGYALDKDERVSSSDGKSDLEDPHEMGEVSIDVNQDENISMRSG